MPLHLVPPSASVAPADDRVVEFAVRRSAAEAAVRATAAAPVRHLPPAFLDALQGSWGTPEEVLGAPPAPVRLAVAR